MPTYIALLRGINVSGQKKIKMADLRAMLEKMPFQDVATYIQSGNIVFRAAETKKEHIQDAIKNGIAKAFGFDVPVLVRSVPDFKAILSGNPYTEPEDLAAKKIYYVLLKNIPSDETLFDLDQENYPNELFHVTSECVYLNCKNGAGKAKLTNNIIEKKLQVEATTRNHSTMLKLLELARNKTL